MQEIRNVREKFTLVSSLKYSKSADNIQEQMKDDISSINSSPDIFIVADKTNAIYKAQPEQYKKLQKENVRTIYKNSTEHLKKSMDLEAKNMPKN